MATVAEFTLASEDFPLGEAFEDLTGVTIELERVVPTNSGIVPYLWVRGVCVDDMEDRLEGHSEIREIELIDDVDEEYLLKLTWEREYDGVLGAITETGVTLLSASGAGEGWTFEIRGDDRDMVSEFQQYCRDRDVPITLTSLHALSRVEGGTEYGLTDTQREALVLAYERGYFRSPREASLAEVAEELDITGQSLGSRIRRGIRRLIRSTLIGS